MITFTRSRPGTHDPATATWTMPAVTTITGTAIQVSGDPVQYQALELTEEKAPTLLFTPTTYGLKAFTSEFVQPGDTTVWNSATFTVKGVRTVAPDGIVITSRIVVAS